MVQTLEEKDKRRSEQRKGRKEGWVLKNLNPFYKKKRLLGFRV